MSKNRNAFIIEEIKPDNLQSEIEIEDMEVVEYEPLESVEENGSQMDEIIVESERWKEDTQDFSGFNSYCCQEYYVSFDSLLQHMAENHFGTLRKSLGAKKDLLEKCIQQYDAMQLEEELEDIWVEESLDYTVSLCFFL